MPLNPNGKIDKPALPDISTLAVLHDDVVDDSERSAVEQELCDLWAELLPGNLKKENIPLDESFFDIGGHSLLATQLVFEIRKTFSVDAPLELVLRYPTIRELAGQVENLRHTSRNSDRVLNPASTGVSYSQDVDTLLATLKPT